MASAEGKPYIGTGVTPEPLRIPARSVVELSMPIRMNIKGDMNNPMIQSIFNSCGFAGGDGGNSVRSPIVIQYQVFADVFFLRNISVMTDQMAIDCPDMGGLPGGGFLPPIPF